MLPVLRRNGGPGASRVVPFFERVFEDFDRVLENAGMPAASWSGVPLGIWEDDDHFYIEAEMPGLKQEEIELTVHKGLLHIRGQRKPVEGRKYLYDGRSYGQFERVVSLPETVDPDRVQASFENGLLLITFKKAATAKPRKVEIQGK